MQQMLMLVAMPLPNNSELIKLSLVRDVVVRLFYRKPSNVHLEMGNIFHGDYPGLSKEDKFFVILGKGLDRGQYSNL